MGCAATDRVVNGPNGVPAHVLRCGAHEAGCYQRAGEVCPKGYTLLSNQTGSAIVPTSIGLVGAPQHSLVIECK